MAESRGGRDNAVLIRFRLHRPAAQPSARGQIPRLFGQECPWSRYPGILWYSRMPRPPAGEPHITGTQCQGYGWVPNCVGISIANPCRQNGDHCIYQPPRWFTLPSHVATSPPPPPLESEASEVPSCYPHPRSVQSGGRRVVSSCTSWGVETPSPGGPADLESVRSCSGLHLQKPPIASGFTPCQGSRFKVLYYLSHTQSYRV